MNKQIKIGIDIDGTLTVPDYWIKPLNSYFNRQLKYDDCYEYDLLKMYNVDYDEFMEFYRDYGPEMHLQANIRSSVTSIINNWHEHHQIYYITARQEWLTEVTHQWLGKHKLPGETYVLGTSIKLPKALELGCDIFIEDSYDVACQLAEGGIPVILLDCVYNRKKLPKGVERVNNWQEVSNIVSLLAGD